MIAACHLQLSVAYWHVQVASHSVSVMSLKSLLFSNSSEMCVWWQNSDDGWRFVCHRPQLLLWDRFLWPGHGHLGWRKSGDIIPGKLVILTSWLSLCHVDNLLTGVVYVMPDGRSLIECCDWWLLSLACVTLMLTSK